MHNTCSKLVAAVKPPLAASKNVPAMLRFRAWQRAEGGAA